MRIQEIDETERPREKLAHRGPAALSDAELLAVFLRTGIPGKNAITLASELLQKRGGLLGLSRSSTSELRSVVKGIGPAKAAELSAIFEVGRRLARGAANSRPKLDSPDRVYDLLAPDLCTLNREQVRVLLVNTKNELIHEDTISMGSINETIAHPREILRPVVVHSAYGFVLAHNHPSGDPTPSTADHRLTRRISEAANLLQVQFLDHIVIGTSEGGRQPYYSFREHGIL